MKGEVKAALCLLIISLPALSLISTSGAAIEHFAWVNPAFSGYDPNLGYIVGYQENTDWNFMTTYTNGDANPLNVSAIRVFFSWGKNYTHSYDTPLQIMPGIIQRFDIGNVTPSTSEVSDRWSYDYYVYIERVNSTAPPYQQLSPILMTSGSGFAVLSTDHLACLNALTELGASTVMGPWTIPWLPECNISKVQVMEAQISMELAQAQRAYGSGIFGTAKTHLQTVQGYADDILSMLDNNGTAREQADLDNINAETAYFNGLGQAAVINAYGWVLFGLGWVFIGIGIVIYAARKPKPPPT